MMHLVDMEMNLLARGQQEVACAQARSTHTGQGERPASRLGRPGGYGSSRSAEARIRPAHKILTWDSAMIWRCAGTPAPVFS